VSETFSTRLRKLGNSIWEAQHLHPFIRGIAEGTLDLERFRFWVRQDYLFLIEYSRLLALAAARAPSLQAIERLVELANATLTVEMELHRNYASEFGIAREELDSELMAPTTRTYTDFLLRTAALGDFPELAAALLPCMWGFAEIGERLGSEDRPDDPRYASWIEMYASPDFQRLTGWCRDVVDR
jgi:thiaminase/transcriptional activator TenA